MIGIAGFAKALEISQKSKENKKLIKLNKYILNKIKEDIKDSRFNGPIRIEDRLSNNVNVSFQGVDGELLLQYLNKKGICVSTGSACSSNNDRPSHVLEAINCPIESINGSIRITLGKKTTQKDIDYFLYYLIKGVKEIRKSTTLINDLKKITKNQISAGCVKMK